MGSAKPSVPAPELLRAEILRRAEERGADKSICPSEVARNYGEDWQRLMTPVRNAARQLSKDGLIDILRKGKPINPDELRGVIRLRIRPAPESESVPGSAAEET